MSLREFYQEVILDHDRTPRNFGVLTGEPTCADGDNPMCGDRIRVCASLEGDRVAQVRFTGSGCAISVASASMMTEAVAGRTVDEVQTLFTRVHTALTTGEPIELPGDLAVLMGVREFPMRVKCATLAWHTLRAILTGEQRATTE